MTTQHKDHIFPLHNHRHLPDVDVIHCSNSSNASGTRSVGSVASRMPPSSTPILRTRACERSCCAPLLVWPSPDSNPRGPCTTGTRPTACWDDHDPHERVWSMMFLRCLPWETSHPMKTMRAPAWPISLWLRLDPQDWTAQLRLASDRAVGGLTAPTTFARSLQRGHWIAVVAGQLQSLAGPILVVPSLRGISRGVCTRKHKQEGRMQPRP